jgi:hypothetical protein
MITSIKKHKTNLLIIFMLMMITGFIIYFMYMRVEHFTDPMTTPAYTCPPPAPIIPASIISRYFGVGFNIDLITNTNNSVSNYIIEHIPINSSGTLGGVYSISSDGLLTIKLRNDQDPTQWWNINPVVDTTTTNLYYSVQPTSNPTFALQYENGNLAIRPYYAPGFEGQKWLQSSNKITRGIPVLNYSPGSLFTAEFDPYSTTNSITQNNLTSQNNQQVTDVVTAVKTGIQQYLAQMNNSQPTGHISASSLGNKEMPLNVNLNLSGSPNIIAGTGKSGFANITGSTTNEDVLSLLDKYDSSKSSSNNMRYSSNDLISQISTNNQGCKSFNINDYTSNRVSSCNCKL